MCENEEVPTCVKKWNEREREKERESENERERKRERKRKYVSTFWESGRVLEITVALSHLYNIHKD